MLKKQLSALLAAAFLLCPFSAMAFEDLAGTYAWANEAACQMVSQGVLQANSETEFGADDTVSKTQLTQALQAAFDEAYAGEQGDAPATREQMIAGAVEAMALTQAPCTTDRDVFETFRDASQISPGLLDCVTIALQNGMVQGYEDSTLRPKALVTKAELAAFLAKILAPVEQEPEKVERGAQALDVMMLYDCDHSPTINTRPDNGWYNLYPGYPDPIDPTTPGIYRCTTSLLGTYDTADPKLQKQHAYWLSAMGVNVIMMDFTNAVSPREDTPKGKDMLYYDLGMMKMLEKQLNTVSKITEFTPPKTSVNLRLFEHNYDTFRLILDDIYAIYEKYPDMWYKLDDGTGRADKPFICIFADWDLLQTWAKTGVAFDDERFNIRWQNGAIAAYEGVSTVNDEGYRVIRGDLPYWIFHENEEQEGRPGYYMKVYKEGEVSKKPEQMQVWASYWRADSTWDGMFRKIDGKLPFERNIEAVYDVMPQVLYIGRFNYPLVYPTEPQEGLSREDSTHIEPNEDWGFTVYNLVAKHLYALNGWEGAPPPAPQITGFDQARRTVGVDVSGYPLEFQMSKNKNFEGATWRHIDVAKGGMALPEEIDGSQIVYIKTRNMFGESPVTAYRLKFDPGMSSAKDAVTVITTAEELSQMTGDGKFELGATIDLAGVDWSSLFGFTGTFDGNADLGYSIKNLRGSATNGLFGPLDAGAYIHDLVIENADITAAGVMSGIITANLKEGATIENCAVVNSSLKGHSAAGGIAGSTHGLIKNCVFTGSVTGDAQVGGIAGYVEFTFVQDCYVNADITASGECGGIAGTMAGLDNGECGIIRCVASGQVLGKAQSASGGIVGFPVSSGWPGPVKHCFAYQSKITGGQAARISPTKTDGMAHNFALASLSPGQGDTTESGADGAGVAPEAAYLWETFQQQGFDEAVWDISGDGIYLKTIPKKFQK